MIVTKEKAKKFTIGIAVDLNLQSDMYSGKILNLQRRQKNGIKHKAKLRRFAGVELGPFDLSRISKH